MRDGTLGGSSAIAGFLDYEQRFERDDAADPPAPVSSASQPDPDGALAEREREPGDVPFALEAPPRGEEVGGADLDDIAHPGLAELELGADQANAPLGATARGERRTLIERLPTLSRHNLPALTHLILRIGDGLDDAILALTRSDVIGGLRQLTLHGKLSHDAVGALRAAGAALETIDVRGSSYNDVQMLENIARTVVIDGPELRPPSDRKPAVRGDWLVRHTRRPEWGIGRVVDETDDGLQVEFEHGGAKRVRNVELLEDIEP